MSHKKIYLSPPHMAGSEWDYLKEAFDSNYIAPAGEFLQRFEEKLCELTGFSHCVAVSSGTAAIHLGLRCLGVGKGDIVFASSLTFIGSVSPATYLGAEVQFIDSEMSSWTMDPEILEKAFSESIKRGKRIGAVIPTDLYGQSCNLKAIQSICNRYDVPILVDSAESLGSSFGDSSVGVGSDATVFSFNGNKILTTSGGGVLASDNEEVVNEARYLSTQARDDVSHFEHRTIGYNYRLSNLLAAVGLGQLEVLEKRVEQKRVIFDGYRERFQNVSEISMMPEASWGKTNRWLSVLRFIGDRCNELSKPLIQRLDENQVEARPVWKPMHLQPCFNGNKVFGGEICELLFSSGLCLPSGTALQSSDLDRISEIIITGLNDGDLIFSE